MGDWVLVQISGGEAGFLFLLFSSSFEKHLLPVSFLSFVFSVLNTYILSLRVVRLFYASEES